MVFNGTMEGEYTVGIITCAALVFAGWQNRLQKTFSLHELYSERDTELAIAGVVSKHASY